MEMTIKDVISSVSSELGRLADQTAALQDQLSPHAYQGLNIEAFQSLDSLTQTLSSLSTYLEAIGSVVPCECRLVAQAALAQICLSALAQRLTGALSDECEPEPATCELF